MNNQHNNQSHKSSTAQSEESVLSFWHEHKIFEKTLEKKSPKGIFTFYDGPPFATGLPHYGHLLAGTIKDIIPRYKTMQGYHVPRKWGWDCHGLPIENLIEKELGLETKKDIEDYGIEKFNSAARNSVLRYESEWKRYVPRSGRFVDMENAYMAMDSEYMESIWWVFSELYKKGLTKEGFKAMHLCPRCETTLSNFEVNQGYKDVTDITVTAKFELRDEPGTFLLAWTTTPWTLPGNVALAVGADIDYVKLKDVQIDLKFQDKSNEIKNIGLYSSELVIVSKDIFLKNSVEFPGTPGLYRWKEKPESTFQIVSEMKGSELAGISYIAPFDYYQNDPEVENAENGWKVLTADFVTTEDGTGIVHIAPAFGSDDMQLGQDNALPFIQHISKNGAFKHVFSQTIDGGDFAGMLVKQKNDLMSTDIEIIKRLAHDGKLFSKQKIVHSYPHCWRCDTPLLNYATTSWYVDVPRIKDTLIASNETVNWVPEHVGDGRFGKWLEGARDWALSRSRFWGTPLPVWYNPTTEQNVIIGSYDELCSYAKKSGNTYYAIRHGESESNITDMVNAHSDIHNPLTEKGKAQILEQVAALQEKNIHIDIILTSPMQRTQETAQLLRTGLGLSLESIIVDERLTEYQPGSVWEGKKWDDYFSAFISAGDESGYYTRQIEPDGESRKNLYKRVTSVLFDCEETYKGKNILIVSHSGTLNMMQFAVAKKGCTKYADEFSSKHTLIPNGQVITLDFVPFPHNHEYEIDIHRPYIDDFEMVQDGVVLTRIPDVFDVWFDSASMPYAQQHYPFENKESFEQQFPAQFIAEGLDQTRGWFYVMTVIGNALFGKTPFENVIVNGLILAEDGKKMSKSLKNYPDPYDMFDSVGADAIRLYMIHSPVVRAEEFAFSEKGVRDVASKVMGRLRNIVSLYEMYKDDVDGYVYDSDNVLDQWIMARLVEFESDVRTGLEHYELDRATRPIFDFVDDFSTWYIRRSRDRFKGDTVDDKKRALGTTRKVLIETAKIIAPFVPFIAEEIWQSLKTDDMPESVHIADWPVVSLDGITTPTCLETMQKVRELISTGLQLRAEAKIKVRQVLVSFTAPISDIPFEYHELILDEMNVKQLQNGDLALDTTMTPELIAEGNMRELLRGIQSLRKTSGLEPHDMVTLIIQTSNEGQILMETFKDEITKTAGIKEFIFRHNDGEEIQVDTLLFIIAIEK